MLEARGRNGWFNVAAIEAHGGEDYSFVELYGSRRGGHCAPLVIQGPKTELVALLKNAVEQVEKED